MVAPQYPHSNLGFFAAPPILGRSDSDVQSTPSDDDFFGWTSSMDVHIDVFGSFAEIRGLPETPTPPLVTEHDVARARKYTAPVLFKKRRASQEMGAKTNPTDCSLCTGLPRIIPASWRSSAAVDRAVASRDLPNGAVENHETFRSFFPPKFGSSFALLIFLDKCFDLRIVLLCKTGHQTLVGFRSMWHHSGVAIYHSKRWTHRLRIYRACYFLHLTILHYVKRRHQYGTCQHGQFHEIMRYRIVIKT
eukprot:FR737230.1.p1 GENE.FR737230.1~~FR737230.1.p1  ORF type:complete len:248 (-),score=20.12 FR737230.1:230-973(-)